MKMASAEVKSASKVVGEATYEIFDTIAEAIETLGEDVALGLINTQHATNAKNKVRQLATGKPSKTALRSEAMANLTADEFASIAGDPQALEALLGKKVSELEKKYAAMSPATTDEDES